MGVYLENNLLNRVETTAARQFIASQLPKTRNWVGSAQVQEENKVVALEEEANQQWQLLEICKDNYFSSDWTCRCKESQRSRTNGRDLQSAGAATTISQSPAVQELLKEVQQVESQLAIDQSASETILR